MQVISIAIYKRIISWVFFISFFFRVEGQKEEEEIPFIHLFSSRGGDFFGRKERIVQSSFHLVLLNIFFRFQLDWELKQLYVFPFLDVVKDW